MEKLQRKCLAHFINASEYNGPIYEPLGRDLQSFSPKLKTRVETSRNILGETTVMITGYEKTAGVEQYYATAGSALFTRLQRIIDNGLVLEDLRTDVVEVKLWEPIAGDDYSAVREEAYIEVVGYGGDTTGYQIPFVLHFTGKQTKGKFCISDRLFTWD